VLLALAIYSGWLAATYFHGRLAWPLRVAAGGWLVAWHGSLQHEAIHGHPTPWRRVNALIAAWPLSLWLPFELYRRSHLEHHAAEHLTLPGCDPETRYLEPAANWRGRAAGLAEAATATLAARLVLGPPLAIGRFLLAEARAVARDPRHGATWAAHLAMSAVVLAWILGPCRMGVGEYLLTFVYPGTALSLLRAFAEHRADTDPARRNAVVEKAPVLGLLFLHNNLHVVHHQRPGEPWYRLPRLYRASRAEVLALGGPVYTGYREVVARYLFRPHDRLVHPAFDPGVQSGAQS
jgi:fatty acid desaturase